MTEGTARSEAADYRAALRATTEPPPRAAAAVRLGDAVRLLAAATTGSDAPDDLLLRVAAEVEGLTRLLQPYAAPSRYTQATRLSGTGTFINHPMIGPANGCAPPISVHPDGAGLLGELQFRPPQEGPPGYAYGGYIAAGFDAVLLMTAGINGLAGPTKELSVSYRAPTPLNTPLRYEAAVESAEDRRAVVRGRLVAGDLVCAEGRGVISRSRLRG
jgi:acyl-coenzyme A thioesterase PaaI-like protein